MAKYAIYAPVTNMIFLGEVEADSPEEALEVGEDLHPDHVDLCYRCAQTGAKHLELGAIVAQPGD